LPNIEELTSAWLIESSNIDSSIFGTGKFYKEQIDEKKENIYSNIDDMLTRSLKPNEE
jgi:segregation and condensation protein B